MSDKITPVSGINPDHDRLCAILTEVVVIDELHRLDLLVGGYEQIAAVFRPSPPDARPTDFQGGDDNEPSKRPHSEGHVTPAIPSEPASRAVHQVPAAYPDGICNKAQPTKCDVKKSQDFEHFLSYSGLNSESKETINKMLQAFEAAWKPEPLPSPNLNAVVEAALRKLGWALHKNDTFEFYPSVAAELCIILHTHLAPVVAEMERKKVPMCSCCAGTGKPISGRPCICGGVGTQDAELQGFRESHYDLQMTLTCTQVELAEVTKYRDLYLGVLEDIKTALRNPGTGSYVEWAKDCRAAVDQLTTLQTQVEAGRKSKCPKQPDKPTPSSSPA